METKGQRVSMWPVRFLVPIRLNQCSNVLHKISLYPTGTSRLVFKWNPLEVRLVNCNSLPRRYIRKWHKRHKRIPSKNLAAQIDSMFNLLQTRWLFQHFNFQFFNIILPSCSKFHQEKKQSFPKWPQLLFWYPGPSMNQCFSVGGNWVHRGVSRKARHRSTPKVDPWVFRRRSEGTTWMFFFWKKRWPGSGRMDEDGFYIL